jgi:outer membrane protein with beta-barrel domain
MTMRGITAVVMFAAFTSTAAPAAAQGRLGRLPIGIRGFVDVSSQAFTASDSFDAIFGESRGTFLGGGAQVTWKPLVFEVSGSRFRKTGERAFVFDGTVFNLGIPTTVTMTPIEVTALYRLPRVWRLAPYAGGGFGRQRYKETSKFAEASENIDAKHKTYHVAAGAEVRVWRWIGAAGEVRYRRAPGVIGDSGVSREFNEKDLGGTNVQVKLIVGR